MWSIICILDDFAWGFQVLLVVLLWLNYLDGIVVVNFLIMFLIFFRTSSSQLLMWISVQWPLYHCSLSMALSFIPRWKVLLFSTLYYDLCALSPFCVFSMFQFLWHNLSLSSNSHICLLCRTIISFWDFCKRALFLFNFIYVVDAYFVPKQALCYLPSDFFVIDWLWWFLPAATDKMNSFSNLDHYLVFHNDILFVFHLLQM